MRSNSKTELDFERLSNSGERPPVQPDELPELPGFATWRAVYGFVLAVFILYVVLMRVFKEFFS